MKDTHIEYMEKYFPRFDFVLENFVGHDTNENKPIIDELFEECEDQFESFLLVELIILHLDRALKAVPEIGEYVGDKTFEFPPGKGREATEEDYREWMESLLKELQERLDQKGSHLVSKDDLYFKENYPAFRELLLWFNAYFDDDTATSVEKIFHVHPDDPDFVKPMIAELKEVLQMDPFPWKYLREIVGGTLEQEMSTMVKTEYRKWMEDVLRELEMRVGG